MPNNIRTPRRNIALETETNTVNNQVPILSVTGLSKSYQPGSAPVLEGIELDVNRHEIATIVGPSGAGKTTLLRCLSGLLTPSKGSVSIHGVPISGPAPQIGLVFQDYSRSLLPWMKTRENVAFPLQGKGMPRAQRQAAAQEALEVVGLGAEGDKYPWQLSGGMQQRVAIARALAYQADVLLMDEPFASVDAQTRFDLEDLVLRLRRERDLTVLVVTHDIDEAVYLADRVIVLGGKPTTVIDTIDVPLGRDRDQIRTKSDPAFLEARGRVLGEVRHSQPKETE